MRRFSPRLGAAISAHRQGLGQEVALGEFVADQHQRRGRLVLIKLGDEGGQHVGSLHRLVVAGKPSAVAVVAAASEKEDLDAGGAAVGVRRDHVGVVDHALHVDVLMRLDGGQRAYPVAVARRGLEIQPLRSFGHGVGEFGLDVAAAPRQEGAGLVHLGLILRRTDAADAGRGAALDLVLQAGPRARGEHRVGAVAQQERALQRRDRAVDRARRGERPEVIGVPAPRAPVLGELGVVVVLRDHDVREGLVVPQEHVVARHEPLDEVRLQEQRLHLGVGGDELHGLGLRHHALEADGQLAHHRVVGDPALQVARLADVEHRAVARDHAVDARRLGQRLQVLADYGQTTVEVGRAPGPAGGRGIGVRNGIGGESGLVVHAGNVATRRSGFNRARAGVWASEQAARRPQALMPTTRGSVGLSTIPVDNFVDKGRRTIIRPRRFKGNAVAAQNLCMKRKSLFLLVVFVVNTVSCVRRTKLSRAHFPPLHPPFGLCTKPRFWNRVRRDIG